MAQLHKENKAPPLAALSGVSRMSVQIQKTNQRSILNTTHKRISAAAVATTCAAAAATAGGAANGSRKRMSMSDVSDMLLEMYKANVAKAPKNQQPPHNKSDASQTSPVSAETAHETSSNDTELATASKNLQGGEMIAKQHVVTVNAAAAATSFHPRIKYSVNTPTATASMLQAAVQEAGIAGAPIAMPKLTAIPTSVLVQPPIIRAMPQALQDLQGAAVVQEEEIDVKPLIHPTSGVVITPVMPANNAAGASAATAAAATSVIQPVPSVSGVPPAAAIAAALLRDGYHNFQQQIRAQELLKQQHIGAPSSHDSLPSSSAASAANAAAAAATNQLIESFLRQSRQVDQEHNAAAIAAGASDTNDGDDEDGDDSRYNSCFDELIESTKSLNGHANGVNHYQASLYQSAASGGAASTSAAGDYYSDEQHKLLLAAQVQAQALRNLEYSLNGGGDYASNGLNPDGSLPDGIGVDGEPIYECRHCDKKYRWKSTLRRHENVECGGKEPSHQCPYCPYKSKQRGNLGVHVRKHHSNLPQLASKRRSKYSTKLEDGGSGASGSGGLSGGRSSSAAGSDDSSSKLIIDCSGSESQHNNNIYKERMLSESTTPPKESPEGQLKKKKDLN